MIVEETQTYRNKDRAMAKMARFLKAYPPEGYDSTAWVYPTQNGQYAVRMRRASSCD